MDLDSYAWFIYVLTLLLTLAIFFIIILIFIKCVQTCIQTRIFCCKAQRHRRGHRRSRDRNENCSSNRQECFSAELSSESCSSCSEYEYENDDNNINNNGISSENLGRNIYLVANGYDNFAFSNEFDIYLQNENKHPPQPGNIINRKFGDLNRFNKTNLNNTKDLTTVSSSVEYRYPSLLVCNQLRLDSSSFCPYLDLNNQFVNTGVNVQNNLNTNQDLNDYNEIFSFENCLDYNQLFHDPGIRASNLENDNLSARFNIDSNELKFEIPPSYDQVIRESTV